MQMENNVVPKTGVSGGLFSYLFDCDIVLSVGSDLGSEPVLDVFQCSNVFGRDKLAYVDNAHEMLQVCHGS